MNKIILLLVVVLVSMLALSACGPGYSTELKVSMADFTYTPADLKIPAGKEITLTVTNDGKVDHEFVIMKKGTSVTAPFNDDDEPNVYWEVEVKPGKTDTVKFTAPSDAGEYEIVCGTPAHFEAGMVAKLAVVNP
jgi:uncharacterized cupredoxin-like copper-binding protein